MSRADLSLGKQPSSVIGYNDRSVYTYYLKNGESLLDPTSIRRIHGPCLCEVTCHDDGGVDVKVRYRRAKRKRERL